MAAAVELDEAARELGVDMPEGMGHVNDAGGCCCPHWGGTCGFHDWSLPGEEEVDPLTPFEEKGITAKEIHEFALRKELLSLARWLEREVLKEYEEEE